MLLRKFVMAYRSSLPVFLHCDLGEQHHQLRQPFSNLRRSTYLDSHPRRPHPQHSNSLGLGISKNAAHFTHFLLLNCTGPPYLHLSPNKLSASMVGHFPRNQCHVGACYSH